MNLSFHRFKEKNQRYINYDKYPLRPSDIVSLIHVAFGNNVRTFSSPHNRRDWIRSRIPSFPRTKILAENRKETWRDEFKGARAKKEREKESKRKWWSVCLAKSSRGDRTVVLSRLLVARTTSQPVWESVSSSSFAFPRWRIRTKEGGKNIARFLVANEQTVEIEDAPHVLIHDAWLVRGKNSHWPVFPSGKKLCLSRRMVSFFFPFFFLFLGERRRGRKNR